MTQRFEQDPCYPMFIDLFGNDVVAFTQDMLGLHVEPEMAKALTAMVAPGARVTVSSNVEHYPISPVAPIALWRLFCRPGSVTLISCPHNKGLVNQVYRDLARQVLARLPWARPYVRLTADLMRMDPCKPHKLARGEEVVFDPRARVPVGDPFASAYVKLVSAQPEAMAGHCSSDLSWIMESANNTPAACISAARAQVMGPGDLWLMSSQTSRDGCFMPTASQPERWSAFDLGGSELQQTILKLA